MADSRGRKPVNCRGLIRRARTGDVECWVENISPHGAKVELPPGPALPDAFVLKIASLGVLRRATVRWRIGAKAGVAFL